MDQELGRRVLGLIFGLSVRDGKLADAETAFMERTYATLGLPVDEDAWAFPVADPDDAAHQLSTLPNAVQEQAMKLLIEAAAVDGVVHDAERRFLEAVARVVGFTPERLERELVAMLSDVEVEPPG